MPKRRAEAVASGEGAVRVIALRGGPAHAGPESVIPRCRLLRVRFTELFVPKVQGAQPRTGLPQLLLRSKKSLLGGLSTTKDPHVGGSRVVPLILGRAVDEKCEGSKPTGSTNSAAGRGARAPEADTC